MDIPGEFQNGVVSTIIVSYFHSWFYLFLEHTMGCLNQLFPEHLLFVCASMKNKRFDTENFFRGGGDWGAILLSKLYLFRFD